MPQSPADSRVPSPRAGIEISAKDCLAAFRDGKVIIVDVRTPEELAVSHVPGTVNIPLSELDRRTDEIEPGPGQLVTVLCHHGVRSLKASLMLRELGFPGALSIAGGIEAWSLIADPAIPRYERDANGCRVVR
jgi:rhodanese-related sulfurtransferase